MQIDDTKESTNCMKNYQAPKAEIPKENYISPPQEKEQQMKDSKFVANLWNHIDNFNEHVDILRFISHGSSGYVHEGQLKRANGKKCALKFLQNSTVIEAKRVRQIKNEIALHSKLKSKNIITLTGVYENIANTSFCLVMEYAKYGQLDEFLHLIQKRIFNESMLGYITKQILMGLNYMYKSNTLHMDIKESNILIDEVLTVKLSDFSVSFDYSAFTDPEQKIEVPCCGTRIFMSPEVLRKDYTTIKDLNKIDMYSLGVMLYHVAYNMYPFDLSSNNGKKLETDQILEKITKNELVIPEFKKKHSRYFKDFLSGLLNKDISKRLSIEEALNHPWISAVNEIFLEKEKTPDLEKFLINLVTDNIKAFNDKVFPDCDRF